MEAGSEVLIGYDVASGELHVDQDGQDRLAALLPLREGIVRLHIFLDRSVVEVFGGSGEVVITDLLEPDPVCAGLELYARDRESSSSASVISNSPGPKLRKSDSPLTPST
jgi:sucrose-6-phosphate hydrolase SacC (GH32 family)